MKTSRRPPGLVPVTVVLCLLNAAGVVYLEQPNWAIIAAAVVILLVTYLVIWFFWQGRNWARWLVMLVSALTLVDLLFITTASASALQQALMVIEGAFGVYLLYWLNTREIRGFFSSVVAPERAG